MDNDTPDNPEHVAIYAAFERGLLSLDEARAQIIACVTADSIADPEAHAWAASRISRLLLHYGVDRLLAGASHADQRALAYIACIVAEHQPPTRVPPHVGKPADN
jgi:hypothetical protein